MLCDVIEGELVVDSIRHFDSAAIAVELHNDAQFARDHTYGGPNLDEAEEDLLDGIQAWLAERTIDDRFAEFLLEYSTYIEQLEYERWLGLLKRFVEA
jgi:hypothetical protein